MEPVALLSLISDLYIQIDTLQAENAGLKAKLEATDDNQPSKDAPSEE